jgi:hypothetical protein
MPIMNLDQGGGNEPMYLVVQLGALDGNPNVPPFGATDHSPAVAQRVGGYWPMGLKPGKKAERVYNALGADRPVYVIATYKAHVIRVMQVSLQPSMPIGNPEVDLLGNEFRPLAIQPNLYQWPGQNGTPWACRYSSEQVGTKTRILLAPTNDLAWIGETLVWGAKVHDGFWNYSYSTPFQAPLPVS